VARRAEEKMNGWRRVLVLSIAVGLIAAVTAALLFVMGLTGFPNVTLVSSYYGIIWPSFWFSVLVMGLTSIISAIAAWEYFFRSRQPPSN
jgi:hypothetical protein